MKYKISIVVTSLLILTSCAKNEDVAYYRPNIANNSSHATVSKILEYNPAPGQYVNTETFSTQAKALSIGYDSTFSHIVTLGAWGGAITFKFDHSVENLDGSDLGIYGNAPSSYNFDEPGVVMVSQDVNNNGIADDEWYELAGSQYDSASTIHNYKVTYYNQGDGKSATWKDNQGKSGIIYVDQYGYGASNPYPIAGTNVDISKFKDSISFEGSLLRKTFGLDPTTGYSQNDVHSLGWWGYCDSYSSGFGPALMDNYKANGYNSFDISWARDKNGNKVNLQYV
ncbi:MAG: hypothetical protein DI598_14220, partial [Pseudopedobacter saltans]